MREFCSKCAGFGCWCAGFGCCAPAARPWASATLFLQQVRRPNSCVTAEAARDSETVSLAPNPPPRKMAHAPRKQPSRTLHHYDRGTLQHGSPNAHALRHDNPKMQLPAMTKNVFLYGNGTNYAAPHDANDRTCPQKPTLRTEKLSTCAWYWRNASGKNATKRKRLPTGASDKNNAATFCKKTAL